MHKIQFLIFKTFRFILLSLSEKTRFKLAEKIGMLGYRLISKRRRIAIENVRLAFPNSSIEEIKKIVKESYKIMAKAFLSTLWYDDYFKTSVKIIGLEKAIKLKKENNGLVVAMIHMGNMEASLKVAEYERIVTVAKEQRNKYLDDYITENRQKLNIELIKKSKTTSRELQEHIKNGEIIGLFSDHRDRGTIVKFFGEEVPAPTGPVSIAVKNKLPLIIGYNIMHSDNTSTTYFTDEIEMESTGSFKEDVRVNTQKVITMMEQIVLNHPNQWMWFHDRWRILRLLKERKNNQKI